MIKLFWNLQVYLRQIMVILVYPYSFDFNHDKHCTLLYIPFFNNSLNFLKLNVVPIETSKIILQFVLRYKFIVNLFITIRAIDVVYGFF